MTALAWVMMGGAIGAGARYMGNTLNRGLEMPQWIGTFGINIIGSFLIGMAFAMLVEGRSAPSPFAPFFITGVLGGFTTFSAFSLEMLQMIGTGRLGGALIYALASVIIGVIACFLGISLVRML